MTLTNKDKAFTIQDAFAQLAENLTSTADLQVGSFFEFVRDIWSQGYANPELFNVWHVQLVCDDIERCLEEGLFYAAVLPRYHFKSTILGHAFSVWSLLRSSLSNTEVLYLSYSDPMAERHLSEMKKAIRRNPELDKFMTDRTPKSDFSFRFFSHNNKMLEVLHGGLFSFKRGLHVNGGLVADDILRDPENPLLMTQLVKAEEHFLTESIFIPNRGAPVIVLGTPMAPDDLFTKLKEDDRFFVRMLPAEDPVPGRKVLMPELYDEKWLAQQRKNHPKSYASEFLLTPYFATDSYISEENLIKIENPSLQTLNPFSEHQIDSEYTIAGFDIGKKKHPSHLSIYKTVNGKPIQVTQVFLDGWDYTRQAQLMNDLVERFDIDRGYFDNTRGEMEDRGVVDTWVPMHFTQKSRNQMAATFERYVVNEDIEMISNSRQRNQIVVVNSELQAPETTMGHGDSFWSNALAVLAHDDASSRATEDLGDMQGFDVESSAPANPYATKMKDIWDIQKKEKVACPECGEKAGWVIENSLCLICYYKDY